MRSTEAMRFLFLLLVSIGFATAPRTEACTIFVLTDTNRALFCNNEDWNNPKTRIWFVPAGPKHFGCAYVGFDNGWAQGGVNTKGLAFDWVAGGKVDWKPDPAVQQTWGNPSERMLESCATVEDAVAFFQKFRETSFSYAQILVADRNGSSVIIGAKDGKTSFQKASTCRGFGYGGNTLDSKLAALPEPTVANGAAILRDCLQKGQYGTKYSDIFDLKTGHIFLFRFPEHPDAVKLNLAAELAKGAHYYDIPDIRRQLSQPPQPLLDNMKRIRMNEYKPIPDKNPEVTRHIKAAIADVFNGTMQAKDYTSELWSNLNPKALQSEFAALGSFESLVLVERTNDNQKGWPGYRYRIEFKNASLLAHFVLDDQNRFADIQSEDLRQKQADNPNNKSP